MNPLQAAHDVVQARKYACGMTELPAVLAGEAPIPSAEEGRNMWSGTDLTEGNAGEAVAVVIPSIESLLVSGAATIREALTAAYTEGLLTGIEHGRGLDR